jgi:hypothetical protein
MTSSATALIIGFLSCIVACAAQGEELVVNGSLEQMVHNFPAGWEKTEDLSGRVTATWTMEEGEESAKALKLDCTAIAPTVAAPGTSPVHVMQRGIALAAGQNYALSFKAKGTGIADKAFSVRMLDTGKPDSPPVFQTTVAVTSGWKEYRFEFSPSTDIPRTNSLLRFALVSTGTLWLDDVSLRGGTGVATDTTMVPKFQNRLARLATKNLVPNASFECGSDGWLSLGQRLGFGGNVAGLYGHVESGQLESGQLESGQGPQGPHVFRLTLGPGVTPESYFDCFPPQHVVQHRLLTANRGWIDVEPGRFYTLSASMRSDRPGTKAVLQFNFNGDAQKGVQPLAKEVMLTEEWHRYSYTVVAPEDGVYVAVGPDVSNGPASDTTTFWADAIQLEVGEEATPFAPRESVELGFNSGRYGNVFAAGGPAVIDVTAHNATAAPVNLTLGIRLTDYWDRPLPPQTFAIVVPAGGRISRPLQLDTPPGFYRAHASWTTEGREHSRTMQLAVIEPYSHTDSPFGLNHGPTTLEACRQIKLAGVTWVRDWAVNWEWAEPQPGTLSFAPIDPHIERLHAAGMNILSLLPSNPSTSWASEAPDSVPNRDWYRLAYAPKDPKLLFDFVGKAAAHYKGSVAHWEFLNEPLWVPDFCLPKQGGYTIETYVALLKGAAAAIRSADPGAKIIGGLAIQSEIVLGDEFIKAGGLDSVDIFNLHPYAGTRIPETFIRDMERIRRVMDEYGVRKPIWATEAAYYGIDEYPYLPWQPPVNHFAANRLLKNEQQAGDYIVRFSTIMLAYGVEKIFWHEPVVDDANKGITDIENLFIGPGGLPRKPYVAVAALANVLGPTPVPGGTWETPEEVSGRSTSNVYGYTFDCGDHSVLIAWATGTEETEETEAWALTMPAHTSARNIAGAPLEERTVALSESPVFITSTTHKAEELARQCGLVSP